MTVNHDVGGSIPSRPVREQKSTRFLSEMVLAPSLNLYYSESCFNGFDFGALAQLGERLLCKQKVSRVRDPHAPFHVTT